MAAIAQDGGPSHRESDMGVPAPHWEWRVFAESSLLGRATDFLVGSEGATVVETYLLSLISAHTVKIRDDCLVIERLEHTRSDGLELWHPLLHRAFPIDADAIAAARVAWGLQVPFPTYPCASPDEFLTRIVGPVAWVRPLIVHQRRTPLFVENCDGEFVSFAVGHAGWESLALTDADPAVVARATRRLGFNTHENTSYPEALKRIMEFSTTPSP